MMMKMARIEEQDGQTLNSSAVPSLENIQQRTGFLILKKKREKACVCRKVARRNRKPSVSRTSTRSYRSTQDLCHATREEGLRKAEPKQRLSKRETIEPTTLSWRGEARGTPWQRAAWPPS